MPPLSQHGSFSDLGHFYFGYLGHYHFGVTFIIFGGAETSYNGNMADLLRYLPHTFIPLFVAIDIVGVLPVFLSLTHGLSAQKRNSVVRKSVGTALITGMCFIAPGETIFGILGITTDDFKIAGGLVLLVFSIIDLVRQPDDRKGDAGEIGIVAIGVPLIVGPAVLTTLVVLVDHYGIVVTGVSFLQIF